MTEPERLSLEAEAAELMKILATAISERGDYDYATAYGEREKVRKSLRVAAITARHLELHPEPDPETDTIIAAMFNDGTKTPEQVSADFWRVYGYMFIDLPKTSTELLGSKKKGLLRRLIGL
jgi:hypothetical protein